MHGLIDIALSAGRAWQSPQTGFVHYCYYADPSERQDTVPTRENFLFVLSLFRSRVADNVNEGKRLLEKLLSYQGPTGNFPVYLHEFPHCYDRWHGVSLLTSLYWIIHDFHTILGRELEAKTRVVAEALVSHGLKTLSELPADYLKTLQIATAAKVNDSEEGGMLLSMLAALGPQPAWYSTQAMGNIAVSLQMVYPSLADSPWKLFWEHLHRMWYSPLQCYGGPAFDEREMGPRPVVNLYELLMARPIRGSGLPLDLQAVLVRPQSQTAPLVPVAFQKGSKIVYFGKNYAYSAIEHKHVPELQLQKGFSPFRLIWGEPGEVRSLVCQGGCFREVEVVANNNHVDLIFTLLGELQETKSREVAFYCSKHDDLRCLVEGVPATVFHSRERVLLSDGLNIEVSFAVEEGDGEFVGHIMPGNRPSQLISAAHHPTEAYDWQIFLRTVKRSERCRIRVSVDIQDATFS